MTAVAYSAVAHVTVNEMVAVVVTQQLRLAARHIDEGKYPSKIIHELGRAGMFAGLADDNLDIKTQITSLTQVASVCAATAFCCWCQSALVWYLRNTTNLALQEKMLATTANGEILGGTALSNPMKNASGLENLLIKATEGNAKTGYVVSGTLPWISNIQAQSPFGIIFATADGPAMALVNADQQGLNIRSNDNYEVMAGTATVVVRFSDVKISPEMLLAKDAKQFIPLIKPGFILLQAGIGLGLIEQAAELIESSNRRQSSGLAGGLLLTSEQLREQLTSLHRCVEDQAEIIEANDDIPLAELYQLRLDLAELTIRAATSAQLVRGASGLVRGKRSARMLREAAFYGVLTPSIRHLNYELSKIND